MGRSPPALRKEVLTSFSILFAGGVVVACLGLFAVYPMLESTSEAVLYLGVLLVGDLGVVFIFGRRLLDRHLVEPVDRLVDDTERIASGDYRHRVRTGDSEELRSMAKSVNALADRLIDEKEKLARNVESLERTNQELVEARSELLRAARLASAGTLATGIAHEVGNPLSAILAYVDVARMREKGGTDPEILSSIRQEAERIDRIVRGLLEYARPEDGDTGPAEPKVVVERVRDLLESQGRLDGVILEWTGVEGGEPGSADTGDHDRDGLRVEMDSHRLEHVLMNLVLNSIQAMESTDEPRIRVGTSVSKGGASRMPIRRAEDPPDLNYAHRRRVATDLEEGGVDPLWTAERVVTLFVEDNGPGIPETQVERIFDPFFTTKEPGHGTGLGLSICARLVEGMGGKIQAGRSDMGGARFEIQLPGRNE